MPPEHLRFGGGAADSVISPIVAVWLLVAIVLVVVLPRRKAIMPFLIAFFTIPVGEVIVVGGVHLTALRILILAVLARRLTFSRRDKYAGGVNGIDWAVIIWSISAFLAFYLQFPGTPALIQGLGVLLDTLGGYLAVRSLIPDGDAMQRTIKTLAIVCAILGACMINEQINHINVFGLLGGIDKIPVFRDGRLRAGATLGCIPAGAFSGVLIPLFVWLWKEKKSRVAAIAGLAGATAMVLTSSSSTSWMALMGSLLGLAAWRLRKNMRSIRWGFVMVLVGLQLVMKAPVWALIARVDLTGSSSGYQRYQLVDMTIRHFGDWWLIGTPSYINWGWDSWDLCNQFAAVALTGGLVALVSYLAIFKRSFGAIGNARRRVSGDLRHEWLLWCFGSALFATVIAHFGINYMAQLIVGLFCLIACINVAAFEAKQATVPSTEKTAESKWASYGLWQTEPSYGLGKAEAANSMHRLAYKENSFHP
jgi:hypothetical protein